MTAGATKRWLVQFGYDGAGFDGWARQPGRRTVEREIGDGLRRLGLRSGATQGSVDVASRTDRGVHARGNALALRAHLKGPALLRALNGIAPDIFFARCSEIPGEFRVRKAVWRWYRYYEPLAGRNAERWQAAADQFVGPLDARSLGRGMDREQPSPHRLDSMEVRVRPPWLVVDVRAPSFVWGMVRRIVTALRAADAGRLSLPDLRAALDSGRSLALPLAEPERLVLWEVGYPIAWTVTSEGWSRRQVAYLERERTRAAARVELLKEFPAGSAKGADARSDRAYGMLTEIDPLRPLLP